MSQEKDNSLLEGILADAKKEAEKILSQTEQTVKEREKAKNARIQEIRRESAEALEEQRAKFEKNARQAVAVEKRRIELELKEDVYQKVIEMARTGIYEMKDSPAYLKHLINFIIEGVIGLNADEAEVTPGSVDPVDEKLLEKAAKHASELLHRPVVLTLSEDPPLLSQGVVIKDASGRTAFNNQIETRILRKRNQIRRLIYRELFGE